MPIDLLSMVDMPPDNWCANFYLDGKYLPVDNPLWGIRTSLSSGLLSTLHVPMRAGEPYIALWPWLWRSLINAASTIGIPEYQLPSSETLRHEIWLITTRNRYPAHSLIHILLYHDISPLGTHPRYALFQSRLPKSIFDVTSPDALNLLAPTNLATVNPHAGPWADTPVESLARIKAQQQHLDGACLILPDGRLARTTLGNIFLFLPGGHILASRQGATPDALCDFITSNNLFHKFNLHIDYQDGFDNATINAAEECFVCSTSVGLRPVLSLGSTKRFHRNVTLTLAQEVKRAMSL